MSINKNSQHTPPSTTCTFGESDDSSKAVDGFYVVGSAQGWISIRSNPYGFKNPLIILADGASTISKINFNYLFIWRVGENGQNEFNNIAREINEIIDGRIIKIVVTDDTFNKNTFFILNKILLKCPIVLFDHLHFQSKKPEPTLNIQAFIRFRKEFFMAPQAFCPLRFPNGVFGYKFKQKFKQIDYWDGNMIFNGIKFNQRVVFLIPLINQCKEYSPYVLWLDELANRMAAIHKMFFQRIAIKLHPRSSSEDFLAVSQFNGLNKCYIFDNNILMEDLEIAGKVVVNLDSSFLPQTESICFNVALEFGLSNAQNKFITGSVATKSEVEKFIQNLN